MVGSILSNFWASLFAFTIYFLSCYPFTAGIGILLNAFIVAVVVFFLTFLVRGILSFILENKNETTEQTVEKIQSNPVNEEITSEEYAEVIKNMLNE